MFENWKRLLKKSFSRNLLQPSSARGVLCLIHFSEKSMRFAQLTENCFSHNFNLFFLMTFFICHFGAILRTLSCRCGCEKSVRMTRGAFWGVAWISSVISKLDFQYEILWFYRFRNGCLRMGACTRIVSTCQIRLLFKSERCWTIFCLNLNELAECF